MNAIAESVPAALPLSRRITERQVFIFTCVLLVALTLAGFVPSSLQKVQAVQSGQRAPFPLVLHVHAVLMGAWMLLLLAQSVLGGVHRRLHRVLGIGGALMLAAIVVSGVMLIDATWQGLWDPAAAAAMPAAELAGTRAFVSNILLLQARALVVFPALVVWGLYLRRRDPAAHRRIMILATAIPVVAGLDRLATSLGWSTAPAMLEIYMVASVLPLLAWDLRRGLRLHYTTRVWFAVNLPLCAAVALLWNSQWWLATAPRLVGVE